MSFPSTAPILHFCNPHTPRTYVSKVTQVKVFHFRFCLPSTLKMPRLRFTNLYQRVSTYKRKNKKFRTWRKFEIKDLINRCPVNIMHLLFLTAQNKHKECNNIPHTDKIDTFLCSLLFICSYTNITKIISDIFTHLYVFQL
jgi:hypothetical protein